MCKHCGNTIDKLTVIIKAEGTREEDATSLKSSLFWLLHLLHQEASLLIMEALTMNHISSFQGTIYTIAAQKLLIPTIPHLEDSNCLSGPQGSSDICHSELSN